MIDTTSFTEFMEKSISGIIVASVSGLVHFLYTIYQGEHFYFTKLVINLIVSGWIGYLCGEIGLSSPFIAIAGYSSMRILELLEKDGGKMVIKLLTDKLK